jgi:intracellular sulfur oxidation DsrE/DsrF family protein
MSNRRDFLLGTAVVATLASCTSNGGGAASSSANNAGQGATNTFDDARFKQIVGKQAQHRHSFGIGGIDAGEGLYAMNNTYATYKLSLGVPLAQVYLVGVLYRVEPVAIAFNDDVWNEAIIPALPHVSPAIRSNFESVRVTSGNPFLYRPPGSSGDDASVESLVGRGATFCVCANATLQLANFIGSALHRDPQTIYQLFVSNLVPGSVLVPTGVWAIHALQEAHFTYLQATI